MQRDLCGESFKSQTSVSTYEKMVHNANEVPQKLVRDKSESSICSYCGKSFRMRINLRKHIEIRHLVEQSVCQVCNKTFRNRARLKYHLKIAHEEVNKYTCEICDYKSSTLSSLQIHFRMHMGEIQHVCSFCGESFLDKEGLMIHAETHVEVDRFIYNHCKKKKIRLKINLSEYLVETHRLPFKCSKCDESFATEAELSSHENIHTSDGEVVPQKEYICEVCGTAWSTESCLASHQRTHNNTYTSDNEVVPKNKYVCEICGRICTTEHDFATHKRAHSFDSRRTLSQHLFSFCPDENILYEVCGDTFTSRSALEDHQEWHERKQILTCEICDIEFSSLSILTDHYCTHIEEDSESRPVENCSSPYYETIYLLSSPYSRDDENDSYNVIDPDMVANIEKISIKIEPGVEKELPKKKKFSTYYRPQHFPCGICHKTFTRACDLLNHDNTDHENIPRIVNCDVCGKLVISQDRLLLHKQKFHTEKIYPCNICQKKFVSCKSLDKHYELHFQKFTCDHCQKSFRSKNTLTTHIAKHMLKQTFNCNKCGKNFSSKAGLHIHERTHSTVKLFKCDKCGFAAKHQSGIYIHMLNRHTAEETIICELCGSSFKNKMRLNEHHKRKHETPKRYACDKCDYRFKQMYQLRVHYRTHTGEKPFICEVCGRAFTRSDGLKEHTRIHHDTRELTL